MWAALRANSITGKTKESPSSLAAMKPKATPEGAELIEILDTDDEDTKEQSSVKEDSNEDIQDRKPAAKDPNLVAIDNLRNELEEVFKLLRIKAKRKTNSACESPAAKKRKISDASDRSSQLKSPPTAVVSPSQADACDEVQATESCDECVDAELGTSHTLEASSDSNENSNFEALLKTAGEEQQRLQATVDDEADGELAVHGEDLVDHSMPEAACEVDGTPQDGDYLLVVEASEDPNCLAVEEAAIACPAIESTDDSNIESTDAFEPALPAEESSAGSEGDVEGVVLDEFPEELNEPKEEEEDVLVKYNEAETWDSPLNISVSKMIQGIKDILPPTFGSSFLFVCGLSCVYVDRLAAAKVALCLLVFCFNIGNSVVESETGDQPVFCVSLPTNPSKSWRALVLSICFVGSMAIINVITSLGERVAEKVANRL